MTYQENQISDLIDGGLIREKEMQDNGLTFDILFDDNKDSNNLGFKESFDYCKSWIYNNSGHSYFEAFKGGIVSIICNETLETEFEKPI